MDTRSTLDVIKAYCDERKTPKKIAKQLGLTEAEVREITKDFPRTKSWPEEKLAQLVRDRFPGLTIRREYHVGQRLRLDIYIPDLQLALEYDGPQHYKYIPGYHKSKEDFLRAKRRDKIKEALCEEQNIILVRFSEEDVLLPKSVFRKIKKAMLQ